MHHRSVDVDRFHRGIGGHLFIASDVEDYFKVMTQLLAEGTQLRTLPLPEPGEAAHDLDYLTNFERKFRKEGRPIYRAAYERTALAS